MRSVHYRTFKNWQQPIAALTHYLTTSSQSRTPFNRWQRVSTLCQGRRWSHANFYARKIDCSGKSENWFWLTKRLRFAIWRSNWWTRRWRWKHSWSVPSHRRHYLNIPLWWTAAPWGRTLTGTPLISNLGIKDLSMSYPNTISTLQESCNKSSETKWADPTSRKAAATMCHSLPPSPPPLMHSSSNLSSYREPPQTSCWSHSTGGRARYWWDPRVTSASINTTTHERISNQFLFKDLISWL